MIVKKLHVDILCASPTIALAPGARTCTIISALLRHRAAVGIAVTIELRDPLVPIGISICVMDSGAANGSRTAA